MELYQEFLLKHDASILVQGRPETYIAACLEIEFKTRQEMMYFFETIISYGYSMYVEGVIKPSYTQEIARLKTKLQSSGNNVDDLKIKKSDLPN